MGPSTGKVRCFAGALTTITATELELVSLKISKAKHARAAGALGGRGRASGACIGGVHRGRASGAALEAAALTAAETATAATAAAVEAAAAAAEEAAAAQTDL